MKALLVLALLLGTPQAAKLDESTEPNPRSKREVEFLMSEGVPFAEKLMREDGEFVPFGAVMLLDGLIQTVGTPEEANDVTAEDTLEQLLRGFREGAQSGQYKATALFVDVRVAPDGGAKTDAIEVGLEHESGYCVNVYYPYTRSSDGEVQFGDLFASPRKGLAFEACR